MVLKVQHKYLRKYTLYAWAILFVFGSVIFKLNAQETKQPPRAEGYSIGYAGINQLNKIVGIQYDAQIKNLFLPDNNFNINARVGAVFYIKSYILGAVGYGYSFTDPTSDKIFGSKTSEHRIWEQMAFRQKTRAVFMEHRIRFEHRFIHNLTTQQHSIAHRGSYRFQTLFPLYTISPHLRHIFIAANDEVTIGLKSKTTDLFEGNQFYAGIGYQFRPNVNIQLGYVNNFSPVKWTTRGFVTHAIQLSIAYNMDDLMQTFFKKKQEK